MVLRVQEWKWSLTVRWGIFVAGEKPDLICNHNWQTAVIWIISDFAASRDAKKQTNEK